jgi:hypothetical protein
MREKSPWPIESGQCRDEFVAEYLPDSTYLIVIGNLVAGLKRWPELNQQDRELWSVWANASLDVQLGVVAAHEADVLMATNLVPVDPTRVKPGK